MTIDLCFHTGRSALITGGSRAIGRMIATGFLKAGGRVCISSRNAAACDATAPELAALGPCDSVPASVFTESDTRGLASRAGDYCCVVGFHSPVVHTPQRGKAITAQYLTGAMHVLTTERFRQERAVVGVRDAVLEFVRQIDGAHI